ncbi:lipase [filamentous cyanobacterium CCP5]|nr:lipase [filamentous cyanobacterium CCP5]
MVDYDMALRCARLSQQVYMPFGNQENPFTEFPGAKVTLIEGSQERMASSQAPEMQAVASMVATDTQAALVLDPAKGDLYVVFRGSNQTLDWINNFQFRQQIYPYGDGTSDVKFHLGFMAAYFAVRSAVLAASEAVEVRRIIATGHSLGGALATIAALDIQYNITSRKQAGIAAYTYGAPRVGNQAMVESYNRRVPDSHRFVYGWDVVTRVPRLWQGYTHVDQEVLLGSRWTWRLISQRFQDHRILNYVEAIANRA